jgi:hypothetical protein
MKHPAYNLRPNKAVDRSLLVERIHELEDVGLLNARNCAYYGFGGPFLDDFRILSDHFPKMSFHSLEKTSHTYKRQKFHKFSPKIHLHHRSVEGFLANEDMESADHLIWWLDYTNLGVNELRDVTSLANSLSPGDVLRITASANVRLDIEQMNELFGGTACKRALHDEVEDFKVKYESYLPDEFDRDSIFDDQLYPELCVRMIESALEKRANLGSTRIWHLGSRIYRDGAQMVTCEFYVSDKQYSGTQEGRKYLQSRVITGGEPDTINVPNLSIKERLFLESALPSDPSRITRLANRLGYRIENSGKMHDLAIGQYARYHKHYPMLGKVAQ